MAETLYKAGYFVTREQHRWLAAQAHNRDGISASGIVRLAVAKLIDEVTAPNGFDLDKELAAFGEPRQEGNGA